MAKTAVFIELMAIQRYIFASNKLKENIGASHIIKCIFDKLQDESDCSYVGGGNALIYFDSQEKARSKMRDWSRELLRIAPGIMPVIVVEDNFNGKAYRASRKKLIKRAKMQESKFVPQTELSSFGITADCSRSGLSAEILEDNSPKSDNSYISSVSYTKIAASKESNAQLQEEFGNNIGCYRFTDNIDELGGSKEENSHIAVVHMDGNDLGEKFNEKEAEKDVKEFSEELKKAVRESFRLILSRLTDKLPALEKEEAISITGKNLPIRPILIGGDDITFVCDARLGLYLTMEFIDAFENQEICKKNKLTVCAGIAIVKTKYPFYRAYERAEALCSNAKRVRKADKKYSNDSLIDFHISFGGLGGSLKEIRDANYKSADGKTLYMRPYSIKKMRRLLKCIDEMVYSDETRLPQSKINSLRDVLYKGEIPTIEFIRELGYRGKKIPSFSCSQEYYQSKGFLDSETPYIDIIELIYFYPEILL